MGRLYVIQLDGGHDRMIYSCRCCHTHLADSADLESKSHCRHGKVYVFFKTVVNVTVDGALQADVEPWVRSGLQIVNSKSADICCNFCQQIVGWKYEEVPVDDPGQQDKHSAGKFILEGARIVDDEEMFTDVD